MDTGRTLNQVERHSGLATHIQRLISVSMFDQLKRINLHGQTFEAMSRFSTAQPPPWQACKSLTECQGLPLLSNAAMIKHLCSAALLHHKGIFYPTASMTLLGSLRLLAPCAQHS